MKKLLESLGVTHAAAGRYFGVHRNTIARWCEGKAPLAIVMVWTLVVRLINGMVLTPI